MLTSCNVSAWVTGFSRTNPIELVRTKGRLDGPASAFFRYSSVLKTVTWTHQSTKSTQPEKIVA